MFAIVWNGVEDVNRYNHDKFGPMETIGKLEVTQPSDRSSASRYGGRSPRRHELQCNSVDVQ